MDCVFNIRNSKEPSLLYDSLLNITGDEVKATELYVKLTSSEWLDNILGWDWTVEMSQEMIDEYIKDGYLSESGELAIHKTFAGVPYVLSLDGQKIFLEGNPLSEYNSKEKEDLVNAALFDLFIDNISSSNDLLTDVNIKKLYEKDSMVAQALGGDTAKIDEVVKLVKQNLSYLQIKTSDKEDNIDDNPFDEDAITDKVLDFTQSFEKSYKENASTNTKLLFAFVPSFTKEGDLEMSPFKTPDGGEAALMKFQPYERIFNKFKNALQGITVINEGETVENTLYDAMVNKMNTLYPDDTSVQFVLGILEDFTEMKQTEFTHAFHLHENNFQVTLIDENGSNVKLTIFNATEQSGASNKLINEWNGHFFSKFMKFNTKENKFIFDKEKAKQLKESFVEYGEEINATKSLKESYFETALDLLKQAGIPMSEEGFNAYLETLDLDRLQALKKFSIMRIPFIVTTLEEGINNDIFLDADGNPVNQFTKFTNTTDKSERGVGIRTLVKSLVDKELKYKPELSESTVMGASSKRVWGVSLPSYLSNTVNKIKAGGTAHINQLKGFYKNSIVLNKINEGVKDIKLNLLLAFRKEKGGDEGVDNKKITKADQTIDYINKTLYGVINGEENQSQFYSVEPADKVRWYSLSGKGWIDLIKTKLGIKEDSNFTFSNEIINIFANYLEDEMNRMQEEYSLISTEENRAANTNRFVKDYHFKLDGNTPVFFDKKGKPVGNAFTFGLFPNMVKLGLINSDFSSKFTKEELLNNESVRKEIEAVLNKVIKSDIEKLTELGIIKNRQINHIDSRIKQAYSTPENLVADFSINAIISNIEYNKAFAGDYASYKNFIDMSKRYPATYTDGIQLSLKQGDSTTFKVATLANIERPTVIYDELKETHPDIARAYSKINVTDAQGWISWDRWKFVMQRSNHWTPDMAAAVERIENNTQEADDWKYTAQPVKGVFFGKNEDGLATYVKYSAAPLVPHIIKGTKLQDLADKMSREGVDEAVVVDGIKVGAKQPVEIGEDKPFNTSTLKNEDYKIQQDLRPKGVKETLLGSQLMKNLIEGIPRDLILKDGKNGGEVVDLFMALYADLSNKGKQKLINKLGLDENLRIKDKSKFYKNIKESLSDKNSINNLLDALDREYDLDLIANKRTEIQNTISAMIKKNVVDIKANGASYIQMSSYLIDEVDIHADRGIKLLVKHDRLKPPHLKYYNKKGEEITKKKYDALKEEDKGKIVLKPGQVFVTSSMISKLIPNWKELDEETLSSMLPEVAKHIIGYRIPNQSLASSDSLEIVGILPESYGDTIIPYADITTKTGSDFDIDKMYAIIPNLKAKYQNTGDLVSDVMQMEEEDIKSILLEEGYEESFVEDLRKKDAAYLLVEDGLYNGEVKPELLALEAYTYDESKSPEEQSKKAVENKLIELMRTILEAPAMYEKVVAPIDNPALQNDIKELFPEEFLDNKVNDVNFFSPMFQIDKKFDNAIGKTGTGLASNQLVDVPLTQLANMQMRSDFGINPLTEEETTSFNQIMDAEGKHRITDVISWFLTAYVDIAKDPWISKGNHNEETANVTFMLIRSGVPFEIVNRIVGQEAVREYVNQKRLGDSKTVKREIFKLPEAVKEELFRKYNINSEELESIEKIIEEDDSIFEDAKKYRDEGNYTGLKKYFQSFLKKPSLEDRNQVILYVSGQLRMLDYYTGLNELGDKFSKTILTTKQDVKGGGKSFIAALSNLNSIEELNLDPELINYNNKFSNTFIETFYNNSTLLALELYKNLFVTASDVAVSVYNDIARQLTGKKLMNEKLGERLERNLYAAILGTGKFGLTPEDIADLFRGNLYNKLYELKEKYPDNIFLELLTGDMQDKYSFILMDNTKAKSKAVQNTFIEEWREALKSDDEDLQAFAKNLVHYSFYNSGFQTTKYSFYHLIPPEYLYTLVEEDITRFKDRASGHAISPYIVDKIFRNNWSNEDLVKKVEVFDQDMGFSPVKIDHKNGIMKTKIKGFKTAPYVLYSVETIEGRRFETLYKKAAVKDDNEFIYIKVPKLGLYKKGHQVFEFNDSRGNLLSPSAFAENNIDIKEMQKAEDYINNTEGVERINSQAVYDSTNEVRGDEDNVIKKEGEDC